MAGAVAGAPADRPLVGQALFFNVSTETIANRSDLPPMWWIAPALRALLHNGLIAYPTEAVYGLGCLPVREPVTNLLRLKRRSPRKGLILVAASTTQLEDYIQFPDNRTRSKVLATWPGPVTWLLPARRGVPGWLRGKHPTVAVRVSAHPVVQALCRKAGPLVSTSANPEGLPPARHATRVRAYFGSHLDWILPGALGGQQLPTEIRDAVSGAVIRPGA